MGQPATLADVETPAGIDAAKMEKQTAQITNILELVARDGIDLGGTRPLRYFGETADGAHGTAPSEDGGLCSGPSSPKSGSPESPPRLEERAIARGRPAPRASPAVGGSMSALLARLGRMLCSEPGHLARLFHEPLRLTDPGERLRHSGKLPLMFGGESARLLGVREHGAELLEERERLSRGVHRRRAKVRKSPVARGYSDDRTTTRNCDDPRFAPGRPER
jgi:hypothetical protein